MLAKQIFLIIFLLGLFSCSNNRSVSEIAKDKKDSIANFPVRIKQKDIVSVPDSIKTFVVDNYPVTNKMLADTTSNNSSHKMRSGEVYSYDKTWFSDNQLKQTLIFELYTDYHRMITFHFYNNDIPSDLINEIEFNLENGEIASDFQKQNNFDGFLKQTTKIDSSYFISDKGFKLGDSKQKAINVYGKPDNLSVKNKIEKLEWEFIGDIVYSNKIDLKGKSLAKESFGHNIKMYFKNGKLIGQILYNTIQYPKKIK